MDKIQIFLHNLTSTLPTTKGVRGKFLGSKSSKRQADHSIISVAKVKKDQKD